jgi:hypothetical protein
MTTEQKIMACAELDGFERCPDASCAYRKAQHWHKDMRVFFPEPYSNPMLPQYLTSHDAILPLIAKLDPHKRNDFISELWTVCGFEATSPNFWTEYNFRAMFGLITATPSQLTDALLKATGMWKD